jgi:hypothetical protein
MSFITPTTGHRLFYSLLVLSTWLMHHPPAIAEDIEQQPASPTLLNGEIAVQLSKQQSQLAGFEFETLKTTNYQPQLTVYGKAVNIQPLLDLQNNFKRVDINLLSAQKQQQIALSVLQRAQALAAEGITPASKIEKLKHSWFTLHALVQSHQSQHSYLKASAQQQWGQQLAEALTQPTPFLNKLLAGNSVLLKITVPRSVAVGDDSHLTFSADGQLEHSIPAEFLSPSPIKDQIAGNSYFFIAQINTLQTGTRVTGWIPQSSHSQQGIMIPESAIIWHNAMPWVYIQMSDQHYVRRSLQHYIKVNRLWFVTDQFSAGERIVVTGGAVLLSEELRNQIPEEDDD